MLHSVKPITAINHSLPLGQEPSDTVVDQMMSEAPGPLNFTMFLTLFGEKLTGKDGKKGYEKEGEIISFIMSDYNNLKFFPYLVM